MQCDDVVPRNVSSRRRQNLPKTGSQQEDIFNMFDVYKPESCAAGQRITPSPTPPDSNESFRQKCSFKDEVHNLNGSLKVPIIAEEAVSEQQGQAAEESAQQTTTEIAQEPEERPKRARTRQRLRSTTECVRKEDSPDSPSCSTSSSTSRSRRVDLPLSRTGNRVKKAREVDEGPSSSHEAVFPPDTPKRPPVYDRAISTGQLIRNVVDDDGNEREYNIKTVTYVAMVHDDPDVPKAKNSPVIVTPTKPRSLALADVNSTLETLPYRSPLKRVQDLPASPRKLARLRRPTSPISRKRSTFIDEAEEIVECPEDPDQREIDTSAVEQLKQSIDPQSQSDIIEERFDDDDDDFSQMRFSDPGAESGDEEIRHTEKPAEEGIEQKDVESVEIAMQDATSTDSIPFEVLKQRFQEVSTPPLDDNANVKQELMETEVPMTNDVKLKSRKLKCSSSEQKDSIPDESEKSADISPPLTGYKNAKSRELTSSSKQEKNSAPGESKNSAADDSPPLTRRLRTRRSMASDEPKRRAPVAVKPTSPTYKIVCEPPRKSLKPILRAARRKSMLARRTLNRSKQRQQKQLHWANSPVTMCVPITPRPGFVPGKVEMPTSPLKMTVRARPDLPIDPGATSDEEKTADSMNTNADTRRRLSSDDILFVKEASLSASITAQKRRRSSRRSTEVYYRAGDSSSQSSTPSEKKTTVRAKRTVNLRRLSCLPPPKPLVDYGSTTDPSDSDITNSYISLNVSAAEILANANPDAPSLLEQGGASMPSEDHVPDAKPVRRSTRRSSMFVRNRPVEQQIDQIEPVEKKCAKRLRRLSADRTAVCESSAAIEPVKTLADLSATKPAANGSLKKTFPIFNSRRRLPNSPAASPPIHENGHLHTEEKANANGTETAEVEEKMEANGSSDQNLAAKPVFPLFQRGRRSQLGSVVDPPEPQKKQRGSRKKIVDGDKKNAVVEATLPQATETVRKTRSQSKKQDSDSSTAPSEDFKPKQSKTGTKKKSSKDAKRKIIEEVDLTDTTENLSSVSSSRSNVSVEPQPVVERVHARWVDEFDHAPFVNFAHVTETHKRVQATAESGVLSLKTRPMPDQEIAAPVWSYSGLVDGGVADLMNGCDPSLPQLKESLVQQVVASLFTVDQKIVFNRLRSDECDVSTLVWTEASRPQRASEMLGDADAVAKVQDWLQAWKQRLTSGVKRTKMRSSTTEGSSKRGRKRRKSSDDDSDFDDEEDSIANPLVLAGATGVGKTALVHALADALGMRVIEMSSNERRATAQLRQKLTGATHTHRVSNNNANGSPLNAFFSSSVTKKVKINDSTSAPKSVSEYSVILIDDADILLPEDDGFWTTLKLFAAESRVPIILTCADELRCQMELRRDNTDASIESVRLSAPTVEQLSAYLQAVVLSLTSVHVSMDSLSRLCREYSCDVRRCLLAVQTLVVARGLNRLDDDDDKKLMDPVDICPLRRSEPQSSLSWLQRCQLNSHASVFEATERLGRFGVTLLDGLSDVQSYDQLATTSDISTQCATWLMACEDELSSATNDSDSASVVLAVRESLPRSQMCSGLHCVSVDYCSYLAQMSKASRAQHGSSRNSRRQQHYFDKITSDGLMIDPSDRLKNAFVSASQSLF